ncbi:sirohydrochlorin chelatase [Streptomyces sp. NRRL S-350]|uniref:sirohydrochlorin chelatase n=1 Tax=Streptomyces sp. NRRL S-350 TaxID=1463902 RepID=UPI00068D5009|nr:sirohydrochlorin chelatase [Streptomyces sp. NRRL S-350]
MAPVLLAVAHGSRDPAALTSTRALLRAVRALRPELAVRCCFLDLARPSLDQALARLADRQPVLVPLLLGTGYHIRVDIPAALAGAGLPHARLAPALGPHPLLADALADRLAGAGAPAHAPVVLAGAGSSDPTALADTTRMARLLAARLGRAVTPAHLSAATPTPRQAVADLQAAGHPHVALATYLLAPGFFARRAAATPAAWTSPPLGAHPAVARLVLRRYDEARTASAQAAAA